MIYLSIIYNKLSKHCKCMISNTVFLSANNSIIAAVSNSSRYLFVRRHLFPDKRSIVTLFL